MSAHERYHNARERKGVKTIEERLWGRTRRTESGCWEFTGARAVNGYGHIHYQGKIEKAHRVAWRLANAPRLIPVTMEIMHSCDNRPCVNPEHLSLGTRSENMQDMVRKGRRRSPRGETHNFARLTDEEVAAIRAARAAGERNQAIADRFGISVRHAIALGMGKSRVSP